MIAGSCQLHSPAPVPAERWTRAEDKQFESLLVEFPEGCANRFESVAGGLPAGKSVDQVLKHYEDLVADVEAIEAGLIPLPNYRDDRDIEENNEESRVQKAPKKRKNPECKWNEVEHKLFLSGLKQLGKGDWRGISRHFVRTKTPSQVASHAQKFFMRQSKEGQESKKRNSIHDLPLSPSDDDNLRNNLQLQVQQSVGAASDNSQLAAAGSQPQEQQQQFPLVMYNNDSEQQYPPEPIQFGMADSYNSQHVARSQSQEQQQQQQQRPLVMYNNDSEQQHQPEATQFVQAASDNSHHVAHLHPQSQLQQLNVNSLIIMQQSMAATECDQQQDGDATIYDDGVEFSLLDFDQQIPEEHEDLFAGMFPDSDSQLQQQLHEHTNNDIGVHQESVTYP